MAWGGAAVIASPSPPRTLQGRCPGWCRPLRGKIAPLKRGNGPAVSSNGLVKLPCNSGGSIAQTVVAPSTNSGRIATARLVELRSPPSSSSPGHARRCCCKVVVRASARPLLKHGATARRYAPMASPELPSVPQHVAEVVVAATALSGLKLAMARRWEPRRLRPVPPDPAARLPSIAVAARPLISA